MHFYFSSSRKRVQTFDKISHTTTHVHHEDLQRLLKE